VHPGAAIRATSTFTTCTTHFAFCIHSSPTCKSAFIYNSWFYLRSSAGGVFALWRRSREKRAKQRAALMRLGYANAKRSLAAFALERASLSFQLAQFNISRSPNGAFDSAATCIMQNLLINCRKSVSNAIASVLIYKVLLLQFSHHTF
jgi:hypothetical protein